MINLRRDWIPGLIAISFCLGVLRWPLSVLGASSFAAGAVLLSLIWSRWSLAQERPRMAAMLAWSVLPALAALVGVFAKQATPWEALSISGLSASCVPLAVAAAPGRLKGRLSDFALAAVVSAPALAAVASLSRPDSLWPVGMAAVPFGFGLLGSFRGMALSDGRRAQALAALSVRAANLSQGHSGETMPPDVVEPGARALLEELQRWRLELVKAQTDASSTGPQLLQSSVALERALMADQRSSNAWTDALTAFCAGADRLQKAAEQISLHLDEVSRVTQTVDLAARQDERGAAAFFASMEELTRHSQQVADAVRALNMRVQLVGTIIDAITGIADRAELLAVNAELESERAGQVERAFALLASEMRRMAEQVISSAQQISADIDAVVHVSTAAASAANAAVVATQESTRQGRELTECLTELLERSRQTAEAVAAIRATVWDQKQASARLGDRGQLLVRVSREATAVVSRLETVTAEIRTLGTSLSPGSRA
ncbi:MAG TPA: methyl-accepting chemotaxis protein [Myxococcaceae bacterium]|nr:methyl-accepting chemotaxis protein [Myxococcaceae bacterium]